MALTRTIEESTSASTSVSSDFRLDITGPIVGILGCSTIVRQCCSTLQYCTVKVKHQYYQYCTIPVPTIATSRYIDEEPDVGLVKTIERQHSHVKTQQTWVIIKTMRSTICKDVVMLANSAIFSNSEMIIFFVYLAMLFGEDLNSITKLNRTQFTKNKIDSK